MSRRCEIANCDKKKTFRFQFMVLNSAPRNSHNLLVRPILSFAGLFCEMIRESTYQDNFSLKIDLTLSETFAFAN